MLDLVELCVALSLLKEFLNTLLNQNQQVVHLEKKNSTPSGTPYQNEQYTYGKLAVYYWYTTTVHLL